MPSRPGLPLGAVVLVVAAIVAAGAGWIVGNGVLGGASPTPSAIAAVTARPTAPGTTAGTPADTPETSAIDTAGAGDACPGVAAIPAGFLKSQKIKAAGLDRTYLLSVPAGASASAKLPVIFVFHGDGGTGRDIRDTLALEEAAAEPAIYVYPDGVETPSGWWDLESHAAKNKDIALFDAIVDSLAKTACIDVARIFSTGFSSGGFFTNHLACERGDRLAAIAPQSGGGPYWPDSAYNGDGRLQCPTPPVPALIIHGNSDQTVTNDPRPATLDGGWQSFEHWAYWNHPEPRSSYDFATEPTSPEPCVRALGLPDDHPVIACFIDGMGHEPWTDEATTVAGFFASIH